MGFEQGIFLAADNIVLNDDSMVLLIKRKNDPFKEQWAFPGGFVEKDEELVEAASRELQEETGLVISVDALTLVDTVGSVGRDPRFRTVSVVYLARVQGCPEVKGQDDAKEARWFKLSELPPLAFDHQEILERALQRFF